MRYKLCLVLTDFELFIGRVPAKNCSLKLRNSPRFIKFFTGTVTVTVMGTVTVTVMGTVTVTVMVTVTVTVTGW